MGIDLSSLGGVNNREAQSIAQGQTKRYGSGIDGDVVFDSTDIITDDLFIADTFHIQSGPVKVNRENLLVYAKEEIIIDGVLDGSGVDGGGGPGGGPDGHGPGGKGEDGVGYGGGGGGGSSDPPSGTDGQDGDDGHAYGDGGAGGGGAVKGGDGGDAAVDSFKRMNSLMTNPYTTMAMFSALGGGSGGGGADNQANGLSEGGNGGQGGSAILLIAPTIRGSGDIDVSGGDGEDGEDGDSDGAGGGGGAGAGGFILLAGGDVDHTGDYIKDPGTPGVGGTKDGHPAGDGGEAVEGDHVIIT